MYERQLYRVGVNDDRVLNCLASTLCLAFWIELVNIVIVFNSLISEYNKIHILLTFCVWLFFFLSVVSAAV